MDAITSALGIVLPWWWRWAMLGAVVVASMAGGAYLMHRHDSTAYDKLLNESAAFRGGVAAAGIQQQKANATKAKQDKLTKELADAKHAQVVTALDIAANSLRSAINSGSGGVSTLPASADSADRICFDRAGLDRAVQDYRSAFLGCAEKGSKAVAGLNAGRGWVREQAAVK